MNPFRKLIRWLARREIEAERVAVADCLREAGYPDIAYYLHERDFETIRDKCFNRITLGPAARRAAKRRGLPWA
jgi:hypothetical protein